MKIPIKFRGEYVRGETKYYGDLVHDDYEQGTFIKYKVDSHFKKYETMPVKPESVAQLVGYDKDGNEIYEGDKIISESAE